MKCEKCNEKEATFFYTATVNGETTQRHLCEDCAREEGFDRYVDLSPESMFSDVWSGFSRPFGVLDSFFGGRSLVGPMLAMPRLNFLIQGQDTDEAEEDEACCEAECHEIPVDAGVDVKRRREITALKSQLESALRDENYEAAIVLRDRIRELEAE